MSERKDIEARGVGYGDLEQAAAEAVRVFWRAADGRAAAVFAAAVYEAKAYADVLAGELRRELAELRAAGGLESERARLNELGPVQMSADSPRAVTFTTTGPLAEGQDVVLQLFALTPEGDWKVPPISTGEGLVAEEFWFRGLSAGRYALQAWLRPDGQKVDVQVEMLAAETNALTVPTTPSGVGRPARFEGSREITPGDSLPSEVGSVLWLQPGVYESGDLSIESGAALGAEPGTVTIKLLPGASIEMLAHTMLYGVRVEGGNHGVVVEGASEWGGKIALTPGVLIEMCAFVDQFNHAVYAAYAPGLIVRGCVFHFWGFRDGDLNPWNGLPAGGTRYAVYALACEGGEISQNVFGWPTQPSMTPVQHRTANPDGSGYRGQISSAASNDNVILQDLIPWDSAIRFQANGSRGETFREVTVNGNTCLGNLGEGAQIASVGNALAVVKRSRRLPIPEVQRRDLLAACFAAGHSGPAMEAVFTVKEKPETGI